MIVRSYEESDSKAVSDFFKRCFLGDLKFIVRSHEPEYYEWKYRENPWGTPAAFIAEEDSKIIGLFSVVPRRIKLQDDIVEIGETGDAYIDPQYQGKGIFWKLIAHAFKEMKAQNIVSFYSTANEPTLKIWTELFRFKKLFEYYSIVRPLDFAGIFRKRLKLGFLLPFIAWPFSFLYKIRYSQPCDREWRDMRLQKLESSDQRLTQLWQNGCTKYPFTLVKDKDYFQNRFYSNPEQYQIYALQRGKQILGYSVIKYTQVFNMKCGHIVDIMVPSGDADFMKALIAMSLGVIKRDGADFASSWAIEDTSLCRAFQQFGFWQRKKRYHVVFGGDITKRKDFKKMQDKHLWSFTHGDSDNI